MFILNKFIYINNITINIFQDSEVFNPKHTNKAIIQYVNFKYIENNFRTIGLNKTFDKKNLMEAQMEFES